MKKAFLITVFAFCAALSANAQFFTEQFQQVPPVASPGSRQGGVQIDGCIFQFFDGAKAVDVYSISEKKHLQRIPLNGHKTWHCNNANVRSVNGLKFPLIYVSQENRDEHCICVFNVSGSKGDYSLTQIQTIELPSPVQMGVWDANLAIDCDAGFLYITGYSRESWNDARFGNGLQIIKFALPEPDESIVELHPSDILDRRVYGFRLATQGAVVRFGKLYQVYGMGGDSAVVCYDLSNGKEIWARDLKEAGIPNEPESLFVYGSALYCVDVKGIVYASYGALNWTPGL
jgi:hypothetical protein